MSTGKSRFVKGPLQLEWIATAARLRGSALSVGIRLWFLAGLNRSSTVTLAGMAEFGVTRWSAQRALKDLEQAGLVAVERRAGRKPIVTIPCAVRIDVATSEDPPNAECAN